MLGQVDLMRERAEPGGHDRAGAAGRVLGRAGEVGRRLVALAGAGRGGAAVEAIENAALAARLGRDLPRFLRTIVSPDAARQQVRSRLENRGRNFLDVVDRAVYGYRRSPYRRLLEHAGCEPGDLRAMVAREGVEGALGRLAEAGVYVTFDELKGRRPAVRGSARFDFSGGDFDNPLWGHHLVSYTSGSGGRPSRVVRPLASIEEGASSFGLALEAHGARHPRSLFWIGGTVTWQLIYLKLGISIDAWFYPTDSLPLPLRAYHRYVSYLASRGGRALPIPESCDLQAPERIARWLTEHARADAPILVNTRGSSAVRIAGTARAMGRSLEGVTFQFRSEPFTAARRRVIVESGARAMPDYASVELAYMAYGCAAGTAPDDIHLCVDRYALVERERPLQPNGVTVRSMLFTTLSDTTPKIAINAELGDSARVERRDCGCLLGEMGLTTHLSEIRSFEKLSSEGTSFARGDIVTILDEVLPARFGGTPLDYQIVEEETADGATLLVLRIDPRVGPVDEDAVRAALLQEMGRGSLVDQYQASLVERARSIVIRRLAPITTSAGKVLPFHLTRAVGVER
jgi:hypothetical protein